MAQQQRSNSPPGLPMVVILLLALGDVVAVPYLSSQNTYLLPTIARHTPALQADWLAGTTDAYPVFTAVASTLSSARAKNSGRFLVRVMMPTAVTR